MGAVATDPTAAAPGLDERKAAVLLAVVRAYVRVGEPVGSRSVVDEAGLSVSSATVRNEMAALEEAGYISHPHTSAGRIPTDKGYRFFVDALRGQTRADPDVSAEPVALLAALLAGATDL